MLRRLIDSPRTYFVAGGVLLLAALSTQFELQFLSRPRGTVAELTELGRRDDLNVLFVLVDTLRADRMGIYGYERPTTPVIDELASRGVVFDSVIAQASWTKTSMASLWTGT
jgi:glucan phosphoethanolaminetransferase (alkaline phosphatase superfamily)